MPDLIYVMFTENYISMGWNTALIIVQSTQLQSFFYTLLTVKLAILTDFTLSQLYILCFRAYILYENYYCIRCISLCIQVIICFTFHTKINKIYLFVDYKHLLILLYNFYFLYKPTYTIISNTDIINNFYLYK